MFNILDFIDSPDIREYNKNTVFVPAEQAVLIAHSNGTTVEEKLAAWQELVDNYGDDEFKDESIDVSWWLQEKTSVRQLVIDTICSWKHALEATLQKERVIYIVQFARKENLNWEKKYCFSYEMAYQEMVCDKERFLEESDWCAEDFGATIERISLVNERDYDVYYFNNELKMIDLMRGRIPNEKLIPDLDFDCCMYVPTPFKCGDLVKHQKRYGKTGYGVLATNLPDELIHRDFWRMNMMTRLDVYLRDSGKFGWRESVEILDLSFCNEDEPPEAMAKLKTVSKFRKKGLQRIALLYKYFRNVCIELKKL